MGKKQEVRTVPTFVIPEDHLGIKITDESCQAIAWKIAGDLEDVHEVHIQKMTTNDRGQIHAIIVLIKVPEGVRKTSYAVGSLTRKVDEACEQIVRELTGFNNTRRERLMSASRAKPARH